MTDKTCGSCAKADCPLTGHVESCLDWTNDEDAPTAPVVHAIEDGSCCDHYGIDDPIFVCAECNRTVGYCMGRDDDYPDLCDDCWAKHSPDYLSVSAQDIAADLAPLTHAECAARGIRHSTEDDFEGVWIWQS